jgi:acetolactate synthase-1/2/3 large subunit
VRPQHEVACLFGDGAFHADRLGFRGHGAVRSACIGIVGDHSAWNQIRFGQIAKSGRARAEIADKLGDVAFDQFARTLGGYSEEGRDPAATRAAPPSRGSRARPSSAGSSPSPMCWWRTAPPAS